MKIMNIIYSLGSIVLIGISGFYGVDGNMPFALLYFFASMAFLFVSNLEKIIKDKVPKYGSEIEVTALIKKSEATIFEMENLAKLVSKTALSLIKRSGRFDGYPEEEQEALKESFLKLLYKLDLSDRDIENVLEEYNKYIKIDYVYLLLESQIAINWPKEELQKRRKLLKDITSIIPSPERIEELLDRNDSLSNLHKGILEDFKYFCKYERYRRPEMISKYKELRNTINL